MPNPATRRAGPPSAPGFRRNPVALARSWQQSLDAGQVGDRSELARQVGVSGGHVTQVLSLLQLDSEAQQLVLDLGDPITSISPGVRSLRALIGLPAAEQLRRIKVSIKRVRG